MHWSIDSKIHKRHEWMYYTLASYMSSRGTLRAGGTKMPEIDFQSAIQTNVVNLGGMTLEASEDRIIVVEDEFKSGYECRTCDGAGWLECDNCKGTGKSTISKDARCSQCQGNKHIICPECKGKQVIEGGLVIPEASERRPTTGVIVSTGPRVSANYERGKSVIYTSFSGHVFELNAFDQAGREIRIVIRVIQSSDILAKVSGHLELRRVKKSQALGSAA
jgi:co-chaperonin GroES (HSP10)